MHIFLVHRIIPFIFLDTIIKKNPNQHLSAITNLDVRNSAESVGQIFWLPAALIDILGTRC